MYNQSQVPTLSTRPDDSTSYIGFVGNTFLNNWGAEIRKKKAGREVMLYAERNYKYYGNPLTFSCEDELYSWLDALPHDSGAQLVDLVLKKLGV